MRLYLTSSFWLDTGCGKTMAVQLLAKLSHHELTIVNCHQTTETSDFIGGLRPTRGRSLIRSTISDRFRVVASMLNNGSQADDLRKLAETIQDFIDSSGSTTRLGNIREAVIREIMTDDSKDDKPMPKRRRIDLGERKASMEGIFDEIEALMDKYNALFEWEDGPLVLAMRKGHTFLLDEMSLAEDAVLERLNPVLEASRTLVLAEHNSKDCGDRKVLAHTDFQLFATMNPGGDYGKRELSPALRSRFTEIWVPPIVDIFDISLVLQQSLRQCNSRPPASELHEKMLSYIQWFNVAICGDPSYTMISLQLSLRDILSWADFVVEARKRNPSLALHEAYCHGARLMHLDGLGLGMGMSSFDTAKVRTLAENFLRDQVEDIGGGIEARSIVFSGDKGLFGCSPFLIEAKCHTVDNSFQLDAPTTALNAYRTLRAMQLTKPILLEGPPGVGRSFTFVPKCADIC
jgi:midasin